MKSIDGKKRFRFVCCRIKIRTGLRTEECSPQCKLGRTSF